MMVLKVLDEKHRQNILKELKRINENYQHQNRPKKYMYVCETWITYSDYGSLSDLYKETTLEELKLM